MGVGVEGLRSHTEPLDGEDEEVAARIADDAGGLLAVWPGKRQAKGEIYGEEPGEWK